MESSPRSVFIGGTGRCGTNILKDSLCAHPDFFGLAFESRFTIDPGGMIPTYQSLLHSWSPFNLDRSLGDFDKFIRKLSAVTLTDRFVNMIEQLARKVIPGISLRAYSHWELSKYFPSLLPYTEELIQKLTAGVYSGSWHGNGVLTRNMYVPVADSARHEFLTEAFAAYLNALIAEVLAQRKCRVFVDDNTYNILYAPELTDLVPNALIVHIYRDPRDVVASYVRQRWSPKDYGQAIDLYCSIMQKWNSVRDRIPENKLMEIRFEDYVHSSDEYLRKIYAYFSIEEPADKVLGSKVDIQKANIGRWDREFSNSDKEQLNSRLQNWLDFYGYS